METYKIIQDKEAMAEFIDWLPELKVNQTYFISLFARKKYAPELVRSSDRAQLARGLTNKIDMYRKIMKLELPIGRYWLKGIEVPQEALALYIHPNPRDMKKATYGMGKSCWDLIGNQNFNLVNAAMSEVQNSKAYTRYVHYDIDDMDADFTFLKDLFPDPSFYRVLQTRGGYHLLVDLIKIREDKNSNLRTKSLWFPYIKEQLNIDQVGDQLLPFPGSYQGGFTPKFITL